jgi:hypothetical protein
MEWWGRGRKEERKMKGFLHLFTTKDEALLDRWNAFFLLDKLFDLSDLNGRY